MLDAKTLTQFGIGIGVLMAFFGIYLLAYNRNPVVARMKATAQGYTRSAGRKALMTSPDKLPEGILKALIPEDRSERTQVRFRLRQAGFGGPNSVRNFHIFRLVLAMIAPTLVILIFSIREFANVPSNVDEYLNSYSNMTIVRIVAVITAVGFYGPTYWLNRQVKARQLEVEQEFPTRSTCCKPRPRPGWASIWRRRASPRLCRTSRRRSARNS